ncbi:MAG: hypothetical protein K0S34_2115 [Bacillales bacterium]|jgi:hypothetical protein|nr:hypothetical protein [Bacillales bacterium]
MGIRHSIEVFVENATQTMAKAEYMVSEASKVERNHYPPSEYTSAQQELEKTLQELDTLMASSNVQQRADLQRLKNQLLTVQHEMISNPYL